MNFTHFDEEGRPRMVDVSRKKTVSRRARAEGWLKLSKSTVGVIRKGKLPKGGPIEVARLAGIMAAKNTASAIPLCHSLQLDFADLRIDLSEEGFYLVSEVACRRATGVEMEALYAVVVGAVTLYDMCKAVDKKMRIEGVRLIEKTKEA